MNKRNKKGLVQEVLVFVVIGIVILLFFAGWKYGFHLITTQLQSTNLPTNITNLSLAASNTFGYVDTGLNGLQIISFSILFGFMIGTFIMAFFSKNHPIMLPIYVLIIVGMIILSVYVSNIYSSLLTNSVLGSTLQDYVISNFIMGELPYIVAIIGFFGIIISLISIIKGREWEQ